MHAIERNIEYLLQLPINNREKWVVLSNSIVGIPYSGNLANPNDMFVDSYVMAGVVIQSIIIQKQMMSCL